MGELVQVSDVMYEGEGSYFIKCPHPQPDIVTGKQKVS